MKKRRAKFLRETYETRVLVDVDIDGSGKVNINTPLKFFNHMLETFGKYASLDLYIEAEGDLNHHIIEDTGITLGKTLNRALGNRDGIRRFGSSIIPMDDALVIVAIDLKDRIFYNFDIDLEGNIEDVYSGDLIHFLRSFTSNLVATIHVKELAGYDSHHKIEAAFKGLGFAFKEAVELV